ncbi:hypothetical protein, partial [uncultured Desulfovibrio sp.]|uniref:hypothetical protein n=1 Tax=uncultured Desulfovibrio sp. TaxID=167968 RepID=UPI00267004ED
MFAGRWEALEHFAFETGTFQNQDILEHFAFKFFQNLNASLPSFRLKSAVFKLITARASACTRPPEQFF